MIDPLVDNKRIPATVPELAFVVVADVVKLEVVALQGENNTQD